jgi:hypothetical protein
MTLIHRLMEILTYRRLWTIIALRAVMREAADIYQLGMRVPARFFPNLAVFF